MVFRSNSNLVGAHQFLKRVQIQLDFKITLLGAMLNTTVQKISHVSRGDRFKIIAPKNYNFQVWTYGSFNVTVYENSLFIGMIHLTDGSLKIFLQGSSLAIVLLVLTRIGFLRASYTKKKIEGTLKVVCVLLPPQHQYSTYQEKFNPALFSIFSGAVINCMQQREEKQANGITDQLCMHACMEWEKRKNAW